MKLSKSIIDSLEHLPDAERGQAYSAIFAYIYSGKEIDSSAPYPVRLAFSFAKSTIDAIMLRRQKARERRQAKQKAAADFLRSAIPHSSESSCAKAPVDDILGDTNPPRANPGERLYDEKVKNVYSIYSDPNYRSQLIDKYLKNLHPGYSEFMYYPDGTYSLVS